jgi:hypothetical protein
MLRMGVAPAMRRNFGRLTGGWLVPRKYDGGIAGFEPAKWEDGFGKLERASGKDREPTWVR